MLAVKRPQLGIALLLMLLLVASLGTSLLLFALTPSKQRLASDAKTLQSLLQAKEALVAWSSTHRTTPGRLPCPEDISLIGTPNEGNALGSCSNASLLIGRLPWRTLGLDNFRDAAGEPLWYVLSPGFRNTAPLGSAGVANGQLVVDGQANAAAALIIAPGPALPGQFRPTPTAGSPPLVSNYLDLTNASGQFITTGPANAFNDLVITLGSNELYKAMTSRVLAEIRGAFGLQNGLWRYHNDNGTFPPNSTPLTSLYFDASTRAWLSPSGNPNLWFAQVSYSFISSNSAKLGMGSTTLTVIPCLATPCP